MKRMLILLLLFVSCFGLVGCADDEKVEENDKEVEPVNKVALTEDEKEEIQETIEKIAPIDYLGKSFKSEELSNDEILRIGLYIFNPRNSGFDAINADFVVTNKAKNYFGIENVELVDITCSCGKTIATYDAEKNWYCWSIDDTHYLEHKAEAYNEFIDFYKIDDLYYVEMYKIFPDLMVNSSSSQYNFYATYSDAERQENVLFTVSNESEFTSALEQLDDSKKVKYTYIFKLSESRRDYILTEYKIGS